MTDLSDISFLTNLVPYGQEVASDDIEQLVQTAETSGFDTLVFGDRVLLTRRIPDTYPFTESGEYPYDHTAPIYDTLQLFTYAAAVSEDIRFKTTVLSAPVRHPVSLTKQVLSLDNLSDGRFDLGVGLGWLENEYEVLDIPFEQRGSRADEFLDIFNQACATPVVEYEGDHHSFQETAFYPRPVRADGPPIWIGGHSSAALRRTAKYGDGWLPGPKPFEKIMSDRERLMNAWNDYDRVGEPNMALMISIYDDEGSLRNPEAMIEEIESYAEAGVTHIGAYILATDVSERANKMQRIGETVIDQLR